MDASEDDQLQAAIRASLAAENRPSSSNDDDEDNEVESQSEAGDWFDSESESRIIGPQAASASEETADGASSQPTEAAETPQAPEEDKDDWKKHLGPETDPLSSIIFRYPDGTKEQWSLPCTSTIQVNSFIGSKSCHSALCGRKAFRWAGMFDFTSSERNRRDVFLCGQQFLLGIRRPLKNGSPVNDKQADKVIHNNSSNLKHFYVNKLDFDIPLMKE